MSSPIIKIQAVMLASLFAGQVNAFDFGGIANKIGSVVQAAQQPQAEQQPQIAPQPQAEQQPQIAPQPQAAKVADQQNNKMQGNSEAEVNRAGKSQARNANEAMAQIMAQRNANNAMVQRNADEAMAQRRQSREQATENREKARRDQLAEEEAEATVRIAAAAKEKTRVMQAEYDLRKRPELAVAFGDCVKNEAKFQAKYVKYMEDLSGQATTNEQKNTLIATAAQWKRNQATATNAMCFDRMQFGFQIVGGNESSVKIASGLTGHGYDEVRKVLTAKPVVFYQAVQMALVGLVMLNPDLAKDPSFSGAEMNRAKAELKRIETNQDGPEPFVWFEKYTQKKTAEILPIITGEVK